jgi:hypothetical protein
MTEAAVRDIAPPIRFGIRELCRVLTQKLKKASSIALE